MLLPKPLSHPPPHSANTPSLPVVVRWKSLYFLKGFRATGPLVQTVTKTFTEIRWFLLLLAIIIFGFGSCFITLFREDAQRLALTQPNGSTSFDWGTTASVFLSLLSILLGNFQASDFTQSQVSTMAILFLVAYVVLGRDGGLPSLTHHACTPALPQSLPDRRPPPRAAAVACCCGCSVVLSGGGDAEPSDRDREQGVRAAAGLAQARVPTGQGRAHLRGRAGTYQTASLPVCLPDHIPVRQEPPTHTWL